jgi:hypothetical protein
MGSNIDTEASRGFPEGARIAEFVKGEGLDEQEAGLIELLNQGDLKSARPLAKRLRKLKDVDQREAAKMQRSNPPPSASRKQFGGSL